MRPGLVVLVALLAGALLAQLIMDDPGYVVIALRGWAVEMSVPALLLAFALLYAATRLVLWALALPRRAGQAAGRARTRRSQKAFNRGLLEIAEGNWSKAERILTRGARKSDTSLLNYLTAARAAQLQGAFDRRDTWLRMAYEQNPESTSAVLLTQAELQIAQNQPQQALATLKKLDETSPEHGQGLVLLSRLHAQLGNWRALLDVLDRIRRRRLRPAQDVDAEAAVAWQRLIEQEAAAPDALAETWRRAPKAIKNRPEVQLAWLRAACRTGDANALEPELRAALKSNWHPELIGLYGQLETRDPAGQLARVERWLAQRPEDPHLLLAAGRLATGSELWGKAKTYFQAGLEREPDAQGFRDFGALLDRLGETSAAADAYRQGLEIAAEAPSVPATR